MYLMDVECSVCGGPGVGTIKAAAAMWTGSCVHSDPDTCRYYLAAERDRLARERAALDAA